jgi:hypothetical protein
MFVRFRMTRRLQVSILEARRNGIFSLADLPPDTAMVSLGDKIALEFLI